MIGSYWRKVSNSLVKGLLPALHDSVGSLETRSQSVERTLEIQSLLLGQLLLCRQAEVRSTSLQDFEFRVFSQFGDDGIIQYLVRTLCPTSKVFVEFGVEDYAESNTRFLMQLCNWRGLVIDSSTENVGRLKARSYFWRHDLTAIAAFVTAENINDLISMGGLHGEIGLLHIDIDGNDYWVWKALDVVSPLIAVIEYNSVFGIDRAITVPYDPHFVRHSASPTGLYFG